MAEFEFFLFGPVGNAGVEDRHVIVIFLETNLFAFLLLPLGFAGGLGDTASGGRSDFLARGEVRGAWCHGRKGLPVYVFDSAFLWHG